jgi:hypothetical protein
MFNLRLPFGVAGGVDAPVLFVVLSPFSPEGGLDESETCRISSPASETSKSITCCASISGVVL